MKSGKFIVLEGADGSGKSSQSKALAEWLQHVGCRVVCCHDPGSTPLGDSVRDVLLHRKEVRLDPEAEMFLYMASRAQLVREVIQPALRNGDWVISDRFLMSNIVYQGHAGGLDIKGIRQTGEIATCGIHPDLTLVLDIDLATASRRMNRPLDRLEGRGDAYHKKVQGGYHIEAQSERTILIDATADTEKVHAEIIAATRSAFPDILNYSSGF